MVRSDVAAARVARGQAWPPTRHASSTVPPTRSWPIPGTATLRCSICFSRSRSAIDLAAHWVADAGWALPDDAGSTFDVLAQHGVLDQRAADTLRAAVGLRNRIAHGYAMLDYQRVQRKRGKAFPCCGRFSRSSRARQADNEASPHTASNAPRSVSESSLLGRPPCGRLRQLLRLSLRKTCFTCGDRP